MYFSALKDDDVPVSFAGHTWPISLGSGVGLGMAYANCQNDLRSHYLPHRGEKVCATQRLTALRNDPLFLIQEQ